MPPPNSRTLKLIEIVKDISESNNESDENRTPVMVKTLDRCRESLSLNCCVKDLKPIKSNNQHSDDDYYHFPDDLKENVPFCNDAISSQGYRNYPCRRLSISSENSIDFKTNNDHDGEPYLDIPDRTLSLSSISSNSQNGDFSPASDDDKEFKPASSYNESSSSGSTSRKNHNNRRTITPGFQQKHTSSSGSSSLSSDSSSSSDSDSSDDSSLHQTDEKAAKKPCLGNDFSNDMRTQDTPSYMTSLQQVAQNYQSFSSGEEDCVVNEQFQHIGVELNNPLPLKILALQFIKTTQFSEARNKSPEQQSRKRKRGCKRAAAKLLRNMGLAYNRSSMSKSKIAPARKMGKPCGGRCRLKCSERILEPNRQLIFRNYWNLASLKEQRTFIAHHIVEVKPKYQYIKINSNRKPRHDFYLTIDNKKEKVCKTFFKNTLGINDRPIRTVIAKLNTSGIVEPDLRGKHENHGTKLSDSLTEGVRKHIKSIPRIESHYLRKQTTREYIEGGKNITDLYTDYKNECIDNQEEYVKIHIYRKIFKEFNISFFIPKKDQCDDCVAYENAEPSKKETLEAGYRKHLEEKEKSREEKSRDKSLVDDKNIVACYDLQAMLPVPKGDASGFYYKSRLNCLNFTISELKADQTVCFFWTEVEGQKGANEIGSCVFRYLEKKSASSSQELKITFYSDNCCGQQKNQFMFSMYIYAVKNLPHIQSITHKFLIKGHTQNEGDSVHSIIEKNVKKRLKAGSIYVPDQYVNIIKDAKKRGNKYTVIEMCHSEFYDIKSLQVYKLVKSIDGDVIKTADIKILKIERAEDEGNDVYYKTSYTQEVFKEVKLTKIRRVNPQLKRLYQGKLALADNKKKDLKTLIDKNIIPPYYASSYYNNIL